ncbi:MAG: UvrD-helicase domain-containing protein [Devosia sp.]|nr:UvrD-helicase domain-containing protein [Devosia sp.]
MSAERGALSVPYDTTQAQGKASDPARSIWVEANAGSGKTFVLTRRVLRLLLAGVRPESILCLTYTKAAAAEMRGRVSARLANWAVMDEAELIEELQKLVDNSVDDELVRRARTLFARALETPGGLRILTIHAFCEAVLHRFPIEAGVPFDFAVIEEDQQNQMVMAARETVLAEGLRGGDNGAAVETLFGLMSDHAIGEAINAGLSLGARLDAVLADPAGAKARLRRLVGHQGASAEAMETRLLADTLLPSSALETLFGDSKGKPSPAQLRALFFNKDGQPRARLMTKAEKAKNPALEDIMLAEQERLVALDAEITTALLVERSEAVLDVLVAIARRYESDKRRHALLDFDDLVEKLGDLFADPAIGPWVRYKLDAGIDHVLVDESQDTNERQWRVIKAIAEEFFAGEGAVDRPRSVFAVGDQKQSIYSFQGAQPALFGVTGSEFARRAGAADKSFARLPLHTSFRTLSGILDAVDKVCDRPDIQAALLSQDKVGHVAARIQPGGTVTLWPPIKASAAPEGDGEWPREPIEAEQSAPRQVAMRIAGEIKAWLESGRMLGQRGRPITPDDVLILVQSRNALFQEIIRALRQLGLPTPGADRLAVTGHIAVLDLLALIDVLLNPAEDLQLAALLRSPLFDVGEQDLFQLASPRAPGQTLWAALLATTIPTAREAADRLTQWRAMLDFERPYEFLAHVLYAQGGLRRFHARLGPEVDEVLSELLELALTHEQSAQPSLQGFAAEMRRRSVSIKRELAEGGGGVRVMTVHGAKGLEAPVVILADATAKPAGNQIGSVVYLDEGSAGPVFFHASAGRQQVPQTLEIKTRIDATQQQEYWRKLYVAMTRAEDELYIAGALTKTGKVEGSWYEAIDMALRPQAESVCDAAGAETALIYPLERAVPAAASGAGGSERPAVMPLDLAPLPAFVPVPMLAPSGEGAGETILQSLAERARDGELARRSGLALHALLQHLGQLERALWPRVMPRALEALLPEFPEAHAGLMAKAQSILAQPALAPLFGPDSRAEVPFLVKAARKGEAVQLSGRIDRLVVDEAGVLVVDYKSDANVPERVEAVSGKYLTQLGLYALVASQLFPGRAVRAAILWTELESLMNLPSDLLAKARADFTLR